MPNRRTGKVARLPKLIRDKVNLMIRDGDSYPKIIAYLESIGSPDFNEANLSAWKDGGHEDWLHEQERLEGMTFKREFWLKMAQENMGAKVHEANLLEAAAQISDALDDFDLDSIRLKTKENPELYLEFLKVAARLAKPGLDFQKYRDMVEKSREVIEDPTLTADQQRERLKEILK